MSDLPTTSSTLSPMPHRHWRQRHILMALVIFLGGAACGAAVATVMITRSIHQTMQHPEGWSAHIAARLTSVLNLTEAQTQQVRQIIARRQDALTAIRRDIQPRIEVEVSTLESDINAVLNDEQRVKWRAHVEKFRAHWLPPVPATAPVE
jgi:Spy/CpxP family protein refolding chaperone